MQISPTLRDLHSSEQHGFLMGGRQSPVVCVKGPQSKGLGAQDNGDGSPITQPRVRVRAQSHRRSHLPALRWTPWGAELRAGFRWPIGLWV